MQPLRPEPLLSDEDYGAIEAAVMETARGRWFLREYARRNRNADTDAVLASIRRLERLVQSAGTFDARDEVTRGMADIAQAIAAAQANPTTPREIAASIGVQSGPTMPEMVEESEIAPQANEEAVDAESAEPFFAQEAEFSFDEQEEEERASLPSASEPVRAPVAEAVVHPAETAGFVAEELTPEPVSEPAEPVVEQLVLPTETAVERDVFGELETFLAEAIPSPPIEAAKAEVASAVESASEAPQALPETPAREIAGTELYPIIELDEEATEALLTQDPPRQELILPNNHLVTQRWARESMHDTGEVAAAKELPEEPLQTGLVTFIDEEPVEEGASVFSAPLRLEPEETLERDEALEREEAWESEEAVESESTIGVVEVAPERPFAYADAGPHLTIGEIEAMPFIKKAALFS